MCVQHCYKKGKPMHSICFEKKAKLLYDNLKQKASEEFKAGEFTTSKGWVDNFRQRFWLKKCQDNRKKHLLTKMQQKSSQAPLRKIIEEKDICPNRSLMQIRAPYYGMFQSFKTSFDFFYSMDSSILWP